MNKWDDTGDPFGYIRQGDAEPLPLSADNGNQGPAGTDVPENDEDFDEEIEEIDEMLDYSMYLKYEYDGIGDIDSLAAALRATAEWLEARKAESNELSQPVDGGWVHFREPIGRLVARSPETSPVEPGSGS